MFLPLYHQHPSLPPKTVTDHMFPPYPIPKTLTFQSYKPSKTLIRSSASGTDALPTSAIQRIADKLRSLGFTEEKTTRPQTVDSEAEPGQSSVGEIFVPLPNQLPKYRVGHTIDTSWSTPENPVPQPGSGTTILRHHELKREVDREKDLVKKKKESVPTLAELCLAPKELKRLRAIGMEMKQKLKVGKAGITEGIVNGIHERWRRSEVVKIICEDLCRMNMKRTHDLLERKTGGLVVWRSGTKIILYRGANYKYPYFISDRNSTVDTSPNVLPDQPVDGGGIERKESSLSGMDGVKPSRCVPINKTSQPTLIQGVGSPDKVRFELPGEAQLTEEADRLLDGLGPRFTDWWGYDPLPVDADLLPAIMPGYRRPFRLLPFGVNPKLTNDEMTTLRRLGRPLPCHFALGRNRKLQGLAAAIIKLWEKCEIAKIAVKRGVQNTNSELMAEELKWLTGGMLISRDKEFIVLYRGKDFLPSAISSAIEERRKHGMLKRVHRERSMPSENEKELKLGSIANGSEDETKDKGILLSEPKHLQCPEEAIERTSIKLSMALEKKAKAEKLLADLEKAESPKQIEVDKEGITEEERYMLRKVGLRMNAFLLLGRRGVFDGTIENMHLHWKYRELVKILCKERSTEAAHQVARILEAESGGILVAVERVSKGYAIIVYRGKNYQRPACLRPRTLLSKREAMKRSLEAQRRQSLKLHVLKLTRSIDQMKYQLDKDKEANSTQSVEESRLTLAKEEMKSVHTSECLESDAKTGSGLCPSPVIPSSLEEKVEASDEQELDLTSMNMTSSTDATQNCLQASQEDILVDCFEKYNAIDNCRARLEFSSESVSNKTHEIVNADLLSESSFVATPSCTNNFLLERTNHDIINADPCVSNDEPKELPVGRAKCMSGGTVSTVVENGSNRMSIGAVRLSNRERLLLRRQALKIMKRPLFAVGRSNIVTGVAKALKAHFQKHPLAIVNVKGRAKGTSVQEVVSMLEEATGAILVSQEPSKVILYRGWGVGGEFGNSDKNSRYAGKPSEQREEITQPSVSPELITAIRLECGLVP